METIISLFVILVIVYAITKALPLYAMPIFLLVLSHAEWDYWDKTQESRLYVWLPDGSDITIICLFIILFGLRHWRQIGEWVDIVWVNIHMWWQIVHYFIAGNNITYNGRVVSAVVEKEVSKSSLLLPIEAEVEETQESFYIFL